MAKRNTAALRKQMAEEVEAKAQETREKVAEQVQASQVSQLRGPIMVTISLDGKAVDVSAQPLVDGEMLAGAGKALTRLCYNIFNGNLHAEVRDTSAPVWNGISTSDKSAFRFLRNMLDANEVGLPKSILDKVKPMSQAERAAFIRNTWSAYVASIAAKRDEARAEGKRSAVRVREVTLQALKRLFKGDAPKGGGVAGLKEKVRAEIEACIKAFKARKQEELKKHLAAALALVEEKPEGEKA